MPIGQTLTAQPGAIVKFNGTVLTVAGPDVDGEVLARPANWPLAEGDDAPPPDSPDLTVDAAEVVRGPALERGPEARIDPQEEALLGGQGRPPQEYIEPVLITSLVVHWTH